MKVTVILYAQECRASKIIHGVFRGTEDEARQHLVREFTEEDNTLSGDDAREIIREDYYFETVTLEVKRAQRRRKNSKK